MRPTTIAMAVALGIGLPCTTVQIGGFHDWPTVGFLAGIGFAFGIILMVAIDELFYRKEQHSLIRQRNAMTDATMISTLEREARLNPPVAAVETPPTTPNDTRQAWYWAIETFLLAGDSGGFSIRRMQGIVGSDTWAQLTSLLADAGWLAKTPGRGYVWADGYSLARAMQELRAERLPFPSGPAPIVNEAVNDATLRNTTQRATT